MNTEAKTLTRITGAGTGVGLAAGTDQDWLQIAGIAVAAISTIWPILQKLFAKKTDSGSSAAVWLLCFTFLLLALFVPTAVRAQEPEPVPFDFFHAKEFSIDLGVQQSVAKENLFDHVDDGTLSYSLGVNYFLTRHIGLGLDYCAPFPGDHPGDGKFLIQTASISGIVRLPIKRFAIYGLGGGGRDWHEGEYTLHGGAGVELRLKDGLGTFIEARYSWTNQEQDTAQLRVGLRVAKW